MAKSKRRHPAERQSAGARRNSPATVSGPAKPLASTSFTNDLVAKVAGTQELAASILFGAITVPADPMVGASTITEINGSEQLGSGGPTIGTNKTTLEFLKDQYRHCKPILAIGSFGASDQGRHSDDVALRESDPGLRLGPSGDAASEGAFMKALAKHRHFDRETDPPLV